MVEYTRKDTHFLAYLVKELIEKLGKMFTEEDLDQKLGAIYQECQNLCLRKYKKPAVFSEKYFKRLQVLETNCTRTQVDTFTELWVELSAFEEFEGA